MLRESPHTDTDWAPSASFDGSPQRSTQANSSLPFDRRYYFGISDGIAAEIVQATSYETFAFRFLAPVHTLVVYERGARHVGETFVEGAPRSTLRDLAGKLSFVPAYHEYGEWQQPQTLARLMYIYFDPAKLHRLFDPESTSVTLAAKLFFEDASLLNTALKLKRSLENGTSGHRLYLQTLGLLLAHELIRFNGGANSGSGANWQARSRGQQPRH